MVLFNSKIAWIPREENSPVALGMGNSHVNYLRPKIGSTEIGTRSRTEEALKRRGELS
jgi:hypothetical protein